MIQPEPQGEPLVEVVDQHGAPRAAARKPAVHQPPGQRHRAVSVLLLDDRGHLLVQQRAAGKYHWPRCWSNTCCGHPAPGQPPEQAARGRLAAELGITVAALTAAGTVGYRITDPASGLVEWEHNHLFVGRTTQRPVPNPDEVAAVDSIPLDTVSAWLDAVTVTGWFPLVLNAAMPELTRISS